MKKKPCVMASEMGGTTMLAGSASARKPGGTAQPLEIRAVHADQPVTVDGRLDDAVWKVAPVYALALCADRATTGNEPVEGGRVRFAWDEHFFYMAVEFDDSDVVAEGEANGEHHYAKGDVAELFLWPEDRSWYWELYMTPHDRQSSFFFPGPGRRLPSTFGNHIALQVAAKVSGTINDWSDQDVSWTAEMAVPIEALTARGEAWGPGAAWRIFVGRYNYSVYLPTPELSALPPLSCTNFHLRDEYARLTLEAKT